MFFASGQISHRVLARVPGPPRQCPPDSWHLSSLVRPEFGAYRSSRFEALGPNLWVAVGAFAIQRANEWQFSHRVVTLLRYLHRCPAPACPAAAVMLDLWAELPHTARSRGYPKASSGLEMRRGWRTGRRKWIYRSTGFAPEQLDCLPTILPVTPSCQITLGSCTRFSYEKYYAECR
jgi:hypothetical protein